MSSSYKMIGSISEGLNKGDFDWVINICSDNILEELHNVKSPTFSFASIDWHVEMKHIITLKQDYISLFLRRNNLETEKCLGMSLQLQMIFLGKELQKIIHEGPLIYYPKSKPRGWSEFISKECLLDCWSNAICSEVIVSIKLRDHVPCKKRLFKIREKEILRQNYKDLLLGENDHDLILKVKDKELKAHRNIMKSRCPVFKSMLSHEMLEKNSGVVDIPDCDPSAFEQFLLYIYTGELDKLDESTVLDLYFIADKYDMENLREECSTFIQKSLSVHVVCDVIKLAFDHSDSSLLEFATKYFICNATEIYGTVEWMSFLKENPIQANELIIKARDKCSCCGVRRLEDGASYLGEKEGNFLSQIERIPEAEYFVTFVAFVLLWVLLE